MLSANQALGSHSFVFHKAIQVISMGMGVQFHLKLNNLSLVPPNRWVNSFCLWKRSYFLRLTTSPYCHVMFHQSLSSLFAYIQNNQASFSRTSIIALFSAFKISFVSLTPLYFSFSSFSLSSLSNLSHSFS